MGLTIGVTRGVTNGATHVTDGPRTDVLAREGQPRSAVGIADAGIDVEDGDFGAVVARKVRRGHRLPRLQKWVREKLGTSD